MSVMVAPRSLADVEDRNSGVSFPGQALSDSHTALCLFSAAWHGRQDAYWVADAGLHGTCVDTDGEKLAEMAAIYPAGWRFHQQDAFVFAELAEGRESWDAVTLDPFTNLIPQCVDMVPLWCELAARVVVLGTLADTKVWAPAGWKVSDVRKRSDHYGGVFWTVLTRDSSE